MLRTIFIHKCTVHVSLVPKKVYWCADTLCPIEMLDKRVSTVQWASDVHATLVSKVLYNQACVLRWLLPCLKKWLFRHSVSDESMVNANLYCVCYSYILSLGTFYIFFFYMFRVRTLTLVSAFTALVSAFAKIIAESGKYQFSLAHVILYTFSLYIYNIYVNLIP